MSIRLIFCIKRLVELLSFILNFKRLSINVPTKAFPVVPLSSRSDLIRQDDPFKFQFIYLFVIVCCRNFLPRSSGCGHTQLQLGTGYQIPNLCSYIIYMTYSLGFCSLPCIKFNKFLPKRNQDRHWIRHLWTSWVGWIMWTQKRDCGVHRKTIIRLSFLRNKVFTKTWRKYALFHFFSQLYSSVCFDYNFFCVNFYETFSTDLKTAWNSAFLIPKLNVKNAFFSTFC